MSRKIIHIDMDAFYASVEQRDFPHLRGKPIAVGGSGRRGVVATCSYEARKYGVRSAMASKIAIKKCPHLIFVPHRFEVYRQVSKQVREIFLDYTDLVEPLSLDEAYLDVTENKKQMRSATQIAEQIRTRIFEETQLTASAGVSYNKFLAKIASDINKPDGIFVITPTEGAQFLEDLPIEKFFGIGRVTAKKMKTLNIHSGADLKKYSETDLAMKFGKAGRHYYKIVRGEDARAVKPNRIRKSIGVEETFRHDLQEESRIKEELLLIIKELVRRAQKSTTKGKTITLKIKYADFTLNTRSRTLSKFTQSEEQIKQVAFELLAEGGIPQPIRLLGVSISNLEIIEQLSGYQLTIQY